MDYNSQQELCSFIALRVHLKQFAALVWTISCALIFTLPSPYASSAVFYVVELRGEQFFNEVSGPGKFQEEAKFLAQYKSLPSSPTWPLLVTAAYFYCIGINRCEGNPISCGMQSADMFTAFDEKSLYLILTHKQFWPIGCLSVRGR